VSSAVAQLSNPEDLTAILSTTAASSMTTGDYYVLMNRSTSEYLVYNSTDGLTTTATAPVSGDADADAIYPYLFTHTSAGYIQHANGTINLPELSSDFTIGGNPVGDGQQFIKRKATTVDGVYTINTGTGTGYVNLMCNSLYLNCDLAGAVEQGSYSDWALYPVNFVTRGESTICSITYIYMHGSTEWYRENRSVEIGDTYPDLITQPAGVKYTTVPSGTVSGSETVTIQCELTGECPISSFSSSYDNAVWHFLSLNNNHLLYNNGQSYITVNTNQTTRPANSYAYYDYQWAFIGNPIAGFKIVNRAAGSSMILTCPEVDTSTNSGGNTYPVMANESSIDTETHNKTWKVTENGLGFMMAREGESVYLNNRSGRLAYWTYTDYGSIFLAAPVELDLTTPTLDTTGKYYMLVNRYTGKAIGVSNDAAYSLDADKSDSNVIWTLSGSNGTYTLQNYATSNYLNSTATSGYLGVNSTQGTFYLRDAGNGYYYLLTSTSDASGSTERIAVGDNGSYSQLWGYFNTAEQWELREVTPHTVTLSSSITSGSYYRLHNYMHSSYSMSSSGSTVVGVPTNYDSYAQVWKITSSGSKYTLQNALTGEYIVAQYNVSNQFTTSSSSSSAGTFGTYTSTLGDSTLFAFAPNNYYSSLHCSSSQSYNVVAWTETADASKWVLEEVTLTDDDLTAISEARSAVTNATNYTSTLRTFFSDYACTTLKSTYANMTDAALRSAMSALPSALQEMAVRVKNDTWNDDATFNAYEKDFRIHNYEIYSDNNLWANITGTGPFARLTNPTGIQATTGDVVYIFVDDDVQDSDASLVLECVSGTNKWGSTSSLSKGCNAIYATEDCELFITYQLSDSSKLVTDYPDIKIHIEGATCNGFFDTHRGHTNNDWMWLVGNMFQNKYLHVKSESTLLNVILSEVKNCDDPVKVMQIWDFVFDNLQSLAGCDKWKETGQYKMLINNFRNENGGNPFWSSLGASFPTLSDQNIFSYEALSNVGTDGGQIWVLTHEMGHGHQKPINTSGCTEASNNSLAQIVNHLMSYSDLFQSTRSSRSDGVAGMISRFNNGYSWIDIGGMRTQSGDYSDVWLANRFIYQLWTYFDFLGNYQPAGGNTGYSFMSALYDALRADPLEKSTDSSNPKAATQDWLKIAKYASQITETDLTEFFDAWGFWELEPTVENENDIATSMTWFFGDYSNTYVQTAQSYVTEVKNIMAQYEKKAGNIMFIEDRCTGSTLATYNNASVTSFGETGYYGTYSEKVEVAYNYTLSGTTVTMTDGSGAVGFKIYDADGNLVYISNTTTFTVSETIAAGLEDGTYTIMVAQGDGTDFAIGECAASNTIGELAKLIAKALLGEASYNDITTKATAVLNQK